LVDPVLFRCWKMDLLTDKCCVVYGVATMHEILTRKTERNKKIVAGRGIVRFGNFFKTQTLPVRLHTLFPNQCSLLQKVNDFMNQCFSDDDLFAS
jgi:hypothetical protein